VKRQEAATKEKQPGKATTKKSNKEKGNNKA
jgi:hypothetical protein